MIKSSKKGHYLEILVPIKWVNITIEELFRSYWQAPKKLIHSWRMQKDVWVNGESESAIWNTPLEVNDKILLPVYHEKEIHIQPTYMEIEVLYEDDHLIIVNKPAGVETHPSQPSNHHSLYNGVAFHILASGEPYELTHVHRLDQETSGAIIFSKHALAGSILQRMLEKREIKRTYKALVHGKVRNTRGKITANIGRDRHHPTRRRVSSTGQHAVTHYKVLNFYPKKDLTLIECQLETGRTHQIRVHLSHLGHPLAGDTVYGGKPIFNRQALHAYKIQFTHPITEEELELVAPYNDEIFLSYN